MHGCDLAFVISNLQSGGAQKVLQTLAQAWAVKGKKICVITYNDSMPDFFRLDPRVQRVALKPTGDSRNICIGLAGNLGRILRLRRTLQALRPKVVLGMIAPTNILTILACLGLDARVVISERNDPARQSFGRVWDRLRKFLYRRADMVTANSNGALATLRAYVPASKLACVPNPLFLPAEASPGGADRPRIITVGRLKRQKAHDILLSAFARVNRAAPAWRLGIIGVGPLESELRQTAVRLGIGEHVDWHGQVREPARHYQQAAIFVLPSRYEGVPNALIEAMSFGLPVVVSDASPGPLEFVTHETTGLVVPVDNAQALAQAIQRLIDDAPLRRRLGENARKRVARCDTAKVMAVWEAVLGV
jgi:glycosyltransferase involved in cell wall biosynthesis